MPTPRRAEVGGKIRCIACKEWKIYNEFHIRTESGRPYSKCKKCHIEHCGTRLKENPPKWYDADVWRSRSYAKKYGVESTLTPEEWKNIVDNKNFSCYLCGTQLSIEPKSENIVLIEHVIPMSRGGKNSADNVLPACIRCNVAKRDMTIEEFKQRAKHWAEVET